jgi:hypothetical protein
MQGTRVWEPYFSARVSSPQLTKSIHLARRNFFVIFSHFGEKVTVFLSIFGYTENTKQKGGCFYECSQFE